ncbi:MAG: hypothetical protein JSU65_07135 [Candidatus Zixiibacteriota bacterium]|nr:MAG: hypothetical protein JSU65_07135 [candidate division Zixibacteria bacterium]
MIRRTLTGVPVAFLACMLLIAFAHANSMANEGDITQNLKIPEPGNRQIIKLDDGSTLVGEITSVGPNEIRFKANIGEISIEIARIREITEVSSDRFRGGQYWFPNPNRTRLYFGPTGRTLKAGEGYFSDYMLFFPGISYGLTDFVTIGGGMSVFPGLGMDKQLFYFTPKVGVSAGDKFALAVSALIVRVPVDVDDDDDADVDDDDEEDRAFVGLLFGSATMGSLDHSLTLGLGYGFVEDSLADKPAVVLGGETRISRRMSLVTENWLFPSADDWLISYGARFFGEKIAVDLAFATVTGEDAFFPGIPWVDFVVNF